MENILIITVGGSCQPIVKSILQNKPIKVYFICSDDFGNAKGSYISVSGQGNVCGGNPAMKLPPDKKNIIVQTELADNFEVVKISNPDSINTCFDCCYKLLSKCVTDYPTAQIIVDYTGGTKTMSSALVLAASNFPKIIISLVAGQRGDLIKTKDGTEQIKLSRVNKAYVKSKIEGANVFIQNFDYSAAIALLEDFLSSYPDVPDEEHVTISELVAFSKFFESWDKFEHGQAYLLTSRSINNQYGEHVDFLRRIMISRAKIDPQFRLEDFGLKPSLPVSGFEIVQDLIYNLERREKSERYDDAMARMYRAIELFAQIYLNLKFGIITSDIDSSKLPEGSFKDDLMKNKDTNKKVQTALLKSYELIGVLDAGDKVFLHFMSLREKLFTVLEKRNFSILAHGFNPISKATFREIKTIGLELFLKPLIEMSSSLIPFKHNQFPAKVINQLH